MLANEKLSYQQMSPQALGKLLADMEKEMLQSAEDLEFEKAAQIRDQIGEIEKIVLGVKPQ